MGIERGQILILERLVQVAVRLKTSCRIFLICLAVLATVHGPLRGIFRQQAVVD